VARRARCHRRAHHLGQRVRLSLTPVAGHVRGPRHQAQADTALPAADERQGRALPPHHGRRLGLRPLLHLRVRASRRA
jgi:hypothetical protein